MTLLRDDFAEVANTGVVVTTEDWLPVRCARLRSQR
jgi:hypothetical protein